MRALHIFFAGTGVASPYAQFLARNAATTLEAASTTSSQIDTALTATTTVPTTTPYVYSSSTTDYYDYYYGLSSDSYGFYPTPTSSAPIGIVTSVPGGLILNPVRNNLTNYAIMIVQFNITWFDATHNLTIPRTIFDYLPLALNDVANADYGQYLYYYTGEITTNLSTTIIPDETFILVHTWIQMDTPIALRNALRDPKNAIYTDNSHAYLWNQINPSSITFSNWLSCNSSQVEAGSFCDGTEYPGFPSHQLSVPQKVSIALPISLCGSIFLFLLYMRHLRNKEREISRRQALDSQGFEMMTGDASLPPGYDDGDRADEIGGASAVPAPPYSAHEAKRELAVQESVVGSRDGSMINSEGTRTDHVQGENLSPPPA
ncbi:hypothetical protein MMC25_002270 [Agyrium rufum]|nr:hypothetical protein [Agyrium rufum]